MLLMERLLADAYSTTERRPFGNWHTRKGLMDYRGRVAVSARDGDGWAAQLGTLMAC
jgi:hypothetical protein